MVGICSGGHWTAKHPELEMTQRYEYEVSSVAVSYLC